MRKIFALLLCTCSLLTYAQEQKVVGYIDSYLQNSVSNAEKLQWDKMTDLIYGFIQPNSQGAFPSMSGDATFQAIKQLANDNNVKFHFSAGGAAFGGTTFTTIGASTTSAENFASNVADLLQAEGMVGFDLDWEFPRTATEIAAHLRILQALRAEFDSRGKAGEWEIAIAVGGETESLGNQGVYHTDYINPDAFQYLDYLNLMSYDVGVSLSGNNHSSYEVAVANIADWHALGCPKEKMVIGVPFYSRGSSSRGVWQRYSQIAATNPSAAYNADNSGTHYYNGRPLLEQKVDLSQAEGLAGLMIWEITYDLLDLDKREYSLLTAIGERMELYGCTAPDLGSEKSLCATGNATLDANVPTTNRTFTWMYNGSIYTGSDQGNVTINVTQPGTYEVIVDSAGECTRSAEVNVSQTLGTIDLGAPVELCSPSTVTLDAQLSGQGYEYEWTVNAETVGENQTLLVSQSGTYSVVVTAGTCTQNAQISVTSLLPETGDVSICTGQQATFTVQGDGTYKWCSDAQCNNEIGDGSSFTTASLTADQSYYVKDISAFETNPTGPSSLSSEKNYAASATLSFDAEESFTIKSLTAGAYLWGTGGIGTITISQGGQEVGSANFDFPDVSGSTQVTNNNVNIDIPAGTGYELTFSGGKINWFGGGATMNTTYEDLITFKSFNQEGNAGAFPNLTEWVLSSGSSCDPAQVTAHVSNCTGINDLEVDLPAFQAFPNPSSGTFTISSLSGKIPAWEVYNALGQPILASEGETIDLQAHQPGIYFLKVDDKLVRLHKE